MIGAGKNAEHFMEITEKIKMLQEQLDFLKGELVKPKKKRFRWF